MTQSSDGPRLVRPGELFDLLDRVVGELLGQPVTMSTLHRAARALAERLAGPATLSGPTPTLSWFVDTDAGRFRVRLVSAGDREPSLSAVPVQPWVDEWEYHRGQGTLERRDSLWTVRLDTRVVQPSWFPEAAELTTWNEAGLIADIVVKAHDAVALCPPEWLEADLIVEVTTPRQLYRFTADRTGLDIDAATEGSGARVSSDCVHLVPALLHRQRRAIRAALLDAWLHDGGIADLQLWSPSFISSPRMLGGLWPSTRPGVGIGVSVDRGSTPSSSRPGLRTLADLPEESASWRRPTDSAEPWLSADQVATMAGELVEGWPWTPAGLQAWAEQRGGVHLDAVPGSHAPPPPSWQWTAEPSPTFVAAFPPRDIRLAWPYLSACLQHLGDRFGEVWAATAGAAFTRVWRTQSRSAGTLYVQFRHQDGRAEVAVRDGRGLESGLG